MRIHQNIGSGTIQCVVFHFVWYLKVYFNDFPLFYISRFLTFQSLSKCLWPFKHTVQNNNSATRHCDLFVNKCEANQSNAQILQTDCYVVVSIFWWLGKIDTDFDCKQIICNMCIKQIRFICQTDSLFLDCVSLHNIYLFRSLTRIYC